MKLSILIPTVNNIDYIKLFVDSVRESIDTDYEILVYANQATMEMVDYLKSEIFTYTEVSEVNRGVAYPCNRLASRATGDVIMYAGDDHFVAPGWDKAIEEKLNPNIFYQYMTPCLFEPQWDNKCMNAPMDYGRTIQTFDKERFLKEWKTVRRIKADIVSPWGPPILTKKLWEHIGGFSEEFPIFASDSDMVAKIYTMAQHAKQPFEFRGLADCGFYHFQSVTTSRLSNLPAHQMNSKQQFREKWGLLPMELYDNVLGAGKQI